MDRILGRQSVYSLRRVLSTDLEHDPTGFVGSEDTSIAQINQTNYGQNNQSKNTALSKC